MRRVMCEHPNRPESLRRELHHMRVEHAQVRQRSVPRVHHFGRLLLGWLGLRLEQHVSVPAAQRQQPPPQPGLR